MKLGWITVVVAALALLAYSCGDRARTRRILEPFTLVPGTPTVDEGTPEVLTDPTAENGHFGINVPTQCDLYQQLSVRKVDILWVVDSSGSMESKQQRLRSKISEFLSELLKANPPIDFHIGVISTDTDSALTRGQLRPWSVGSLSGNFISCTPQQTGGLLCNTSPNVASATSSAEAAFNSMANVGLSGSAQERGLYAAYLALTNPDNITGSGGDRFIRPDAALYVIFVSDEDDASCNPVVRQATCTADPGCRCASDQALAGTGAFGSTEYFTRFFETYKGYGNADAVAVAAIVAMDDGPDAGVPAQYGDTSQHVGCCKSRDGGSCPKSGTYAVDAGYDVGYFGSRYMKVAAETGGTAVSICDDNFTGALKALGYAASGLRREYRLSRGPEVRPMGNVATGFKLYVSAPTAANCTVDGNCPMGQFCRSNRCAKRVDVTTAPSANAPDYVKCEGSSLRNIIRFEGSSVPESLSAVEICYDVQANFQNSCP